MPRFFGVRGGKGEFLEASVARSVERHLHAVEIVTLDGFGHYFAVGVAGHADKACHLLVAGFHQAFHRAVGRFDLGEIVGLSQAVDVHEVHVIGIAGASSWLPDGA